MNATVTRSAAKSTAKKASATAASAKAKKPVLKTTSTKLSGTISPAIKKSAGTTKSVAKPARSTVKSKAATPSKSATGNDVKDIAAKKAPPMEASTSATQSKSVNARETASTPASKAGAKRASEVSMSSNNWSGGLTDKMEQPVVSKVSEVATKTTKSSPVPAEGALLTEEQILKMSDKDYMNEAQLAFFKARLQQLERDLLKNAGETTEHLRETVLVPDPADRATIEEEHALELRTRDRERKLLKKVQQSIASINAGEYGWCEETGEPIGIPRLLARPTATLSLEAQQRRELKQKLYGD